MFDINKLKKVNHVITHAKCADGLASALLIQDVLNIKVTYLDHYSPLWETMVPTEGMLCCDIIPPKHRIKDFFDKEILMIDHHKYNRNILKDYKHKVFVDDVPGVAATNLVYDNVFLPLSQRDEVEKELISVFQRNIGVRDTWMDDSIYWEEAMVMSPVLRFFPESYWEGHVPYLLPHEIDIGRILLSKTNNALNNLNFKKTVFKGYKICYIIVDSDDSIGDASFSDCADVLMKRDGFDLVLGFVHMLNGEQEFLKVHLRSKSIDTSIIATAFEGGGHKKASGFRLAISPHCGHLNILQNSLENFLRGTNEL